MAKTQNPTQHAKERGSQSLANTVRVPDDEAEDNEGRSILDSVQKSEEYGACSGQENPSVENPEKNTFNLNYNDRRLRYKDIDKSLA